MLIHVFVNMGNFRFFDFYIYSILIEGLITHTHTHTHTHTQRDLLEAFWRQLEVLRVRNREKANLEL